MEPLIFLPRHSIYEPKVSRLNSLCLLQQFARWNGLQKQSANWIDIKIPVFLTMRLSLVIFPNFKTPFFFWIYKLVWKDKRQDVSTTEQEHFLNYVQDYPRCQKPGPTLFIKEEGMAGWGEQNQSYIGRQKARSYVWWIVHQGLGWFRTPSVVLVVNSRVWQADQTQ